MRQARAALFSYNYYKNADMSHSQVIPDSKPLVLPVKHLADGIPNFRNNRLLTYLSVMSADVVALMISLLAAVVLRRTYDSTMDVLQYVPFVAAIPFFVLIYMLAELYPGVALNPVEELRKVAYATTIGYLILITATFLVKQGPFYSRLIFIGAWICGILLVILFRNLVRGVLANRPWWGIPIVILGAGKTGTLMLNILRKHPYYGFKPAVILDDDPAKHRPADAAGNPPVLGGLDLAPWVSKHFRLHYALVAMPSVPSRDLSRILHQHAHQFPHFLLIPDLFGLTSLWVTAKDLGGVLGLEIQQNLIRRTPQLLKRTMELVMVVVGGACLLPLLILLMVAVKVSSKGPVFFSQARVGKHGRMFNCWKFRSMYPDSEHVLQEFLAAHPELQEHCNRYMKLPKDPRVTPIGRILRKTSLDELPQLWNVLIGDMSIVGPRPIVEKEIKKYGDGFELYCKVRPGITGLWQISGRANTSFEERAKFDEYYVRNWSVWLDLSILGRTIKTVLRAEGAY